MERKNAWKKYGKEDLKTVFDFSEAYRQFISCCKTERECVKEAVRLAKEQGRHDLVAAGACVDLRVILDLLSQVYHLFPPGNRIIVQVDQMRIR